MLIAILVSDVAARVRTQAVTAIGRLRTTESLYAFSRKLAGTATLDDVLWATAHQTALMLKVRVVLLLPEDGVLTVSGYPPEDELDRADLAAANWTWSNDRPAERGSDTLPGAKRLFLPTGRGLIGVIGTLVDCVERPDLAAGTEELSNALQTVRALDDQARRVDDSSREPVARWYPRLLAGEPSRRPLRRRTPRKIADRREERHVRQGRPPEAWCELVLAEWQERLAPLFEHDRGEMSFLDALYEEGRIDVSSLQGDAAVKHAIENFPALQWKALNIRNHDAGLPRLWAGSDVTPEGE